MVAFRGGSADNRLSPHLPLNNAPSQCEQSWRRSLAALPLSLFVRVSLLLTGPIVFRRDVRLSPSLPLRPWRLSFIHSCKADSPCSLTVHTAPSSLCLPLMSCSRGDSKCHFYTSRVCLTVSNSLCFVSLYVLSVVRLPCNFSAICNIALVSSETLEEFFAFLVLFIQ